MNRVRGLLFAGLLLLRPYPAVAECAELPIRYEIGAIDPRFGLAPAEVQALVNRAAAWWENAAGVDLFQYSPNDATLTISFSYTQEQRLTQAAKPIQGQIEEARRRHGESASALQQRRAAVDREVAFS